MWSLIAVPLILVHAQGYQPNPHAVTTVVGTYDQDVCTELKHMAIETNKNKKVTYECQSEIQTSFISLPPLPRWLK